MSKPQARLCRVEDSDHVSLPFTAVNAVFLLTPNKVLRLFRKAKRSYALSSVITSAGRGSFDSIEAVP